MRFTACLAWLGVASAGCQLADDTLDPIDDDSIEDPVAERAPPLTITVGPERSVDDPVPGYPAGAGVPADSHLAWNRRSRSFVAWREERITENGPESEILGAFVDAGGLASPGAFVVSRAPGPYYELDAALVPGSNLQQVAVTWRTDDLATRVVYNFHDRVRESYTVTAAPPLAHADEAFATWNGRSLRVWIDGAGAVVAQRHVGDPFILSNGVGVKSDVDLAWRNGDTWVVTWRNGDDVHLTRVSQFNGYGGALDTHLEGTTVVGGVAITGAGVQSHPRVGCEGSCFVVYEDDRNAATTGLDLYGAAVSFTSSLQITERAVSTAAGDDLVPEAGYANHRWYVTWSGETGGARRLREVRIGSTVSSPVELDGVQPRNSERDSAVSGSPDGELVVWADTRAAGGTDIIGMRYSRSGPKIDAAAFTIAGGTGEQATPAVAFDGLHYVVAWSDGRDGEAKIRYADVDPAGIVVQPGGVAVSTADGFQTHPAVASPGVGTATLIVWEDRRDEATTGVDIYGAIYGPSGVVEPELAICTAPGDQLRPSATFNDTSTTFLVAWSDGRNADADIHLARVLPNGVAESDVAITTGLGDQLAPDLAQHDGVPVVVWEDHREDGSQVFATRIQEGTPLPITPNGFLVASGGAVQPQVTAMEDGAVLIAWIAPPALDVVAGRMLSDTAELGPPVDLAVADDGAPMAFAMPTFNALPHRTSIVDARWRRPDGVTRLFRRIVRAQ